MGLTVEGILLTHGHPDHAPGAAILKGLVQAPVWAHERMPEAQRAAAGVDRNYQQEERFGTGVDELRVIPSPGHSPDHVALWMPGPRILFSGDTILGEGTTLIAPPEGNMAQYMETLSRLRELDSLLIAPGHGPVVRDPAGKIDAYIAHRRRREAEIVAALRSGPASIRDLVSRIYTDVDPGLHDLAAASVNAQLEKLEHEGRVRRSGDSFALAEG
jgi:glyoxylase-like metal-dependent hydrolase (beta-lactamase superfamily II)